MDFLNRLLPEKGAYYCIARLLPGGGFAHTFFDTREATILALKSADTQGITIYLAQASFDPTSKANWHHNKLLPYGAPKTDRRKERTVAQAQYLRSFFIDIDCGEEKFKKEPHKSYPSQLEGAKAVRALCRDTGLPFPTMVNSGNGLYAHWLISEDVPVEKWRALAHIFKDILVAYGFKQDPSRTSDAASVLRPVGTTNRKNEPKPVVLLNEAEPLSLGTFASILESASKAKKIPTPALRVPASFRGLNDEFTAGLEGPPPSLEKIATKCAQVRAVRDSRGDVSEPHWYAFIGLARFTQEAQEGDNQIIHDWSSGHEAYSADITDAKINHHESTGVGPTTCAKFASDNPDGCLACPSSNKIKSPIVLGRPELEAPAEATPEEVSHIPYGFRRTEDGLFFEEEDTAPIRFYPYDLYPCKLAFDGSLGYETVTIRHQMPVTKEYKEFAIRSALLHDPKNLLMGLADHHVHCSGKEARQLMCAYIDQYLAKLRSTKPLATLHSQMGWRPQDGEQVFVLGDKVLLEGGREETTGFARNIPECAKAFKSQGDLSAWVEATKVLGLPGMEPLAFAFLAGAFGAPLMHFTGFSGAMISLVGRSGIGKTLVGEWVLSTYGDPRGLTLLKNDTVNALVSRLGLYGSLPIYLDEVSNIEGQELSDLLYRVTQGRDKARLHRSGAERGNLNSWNTVAIATSNHSLVDKLATLKADASAEMNRVLEVRAQPVEQFTRELATHVYRTFQKNHGVAGPEYIRYLVEHQLEHREKIDALSARIDAMSEASAEERFWSAMCSVTIYGGMIASSIGLIRFPIAPIMSWMVKQVRDMRYAKNELTVSQIDVLGQMLDENAFGVLVTTNDRQKQGIPSIVKEPRGPLVARVMVDRNLVWISRAAIQKHLQKHYGSYSELRDELTKCGALVSATARKVLGSGTYIGGTQQPVWEIDLGCPALGRQTLAVVRSLVERREEKEGRG